MSKIISVVGDGTIRNLVSTWQENVAKNVIRVFFNNLSLKFEPELKLSIVKKTRGCYVWQVWRAKTRQSHRYCVTCMWAKYHGKGAGGILFTLLCMETCRYKNVHLWVQGPGLECNALAATRCCRQQNAPESESIWSVDSPGFINNNVSVWHKCHVSWMSVSRGLPECPDACDMRPLEAGEQLRSIRTMAAVHSVMMTGLPLRLIPNIFFSEPGHSSPRRRWSLRSLWPDLRPRLGLAAPVSSPELLSSSSDKVSLPRLFLDLKYLTMKNILPV